MTHPFDERLAYCLNRGYCPDCAENAGFVPGPRGGASQNIECKACAKRFNVTVYNGVTVLAQRIDYNGPWPQQGETDAEIQH